MPMTVFISIRTPLTLNGNVNAFLSLIVLRLKITHGKMYTAGARGLLLSTHGRSENMIIFEDLRKMVPCKNRPRDSTTQFFLWFWNAQLFDVLHFAGTDSRASSLEGHYMLHASPPS